MPDLDSRPPGGRVTPQDLSTRLRRRHRGLALLAWALLLAAGPLAAADRTEDQRVIWNFQDDVPLPASSHFGAALAVTEEGSGEAWIAAPQGGLWTRLVRDPPFGFTGWAIVSVSPSPWVPQAYAGVGFYDLLLHTELASDGTTSIGAVGDTPVVSGIVGDVAALDASLAILAIGQPDHAGGAGRVLVYVVSMITASYELEATFVGGAGDRLGASVAAKDGFVLAGAPGNGANGSVYVYAQGDEWFEWQRIDSPSTTQVDEQFGAAIALDGDWLAIGSPFHDRFLPGGASQVDCGGVWVYHPSGLLFQLDAFVRPAGIAAGDRFGSSVALRRLGLGATLVAGSPRADHLFGNSGAAYLFLRSATGWSERLRLIDSAPGAANNLGAKVAMNDHDVLVSAPNATANGVSQQGQVLAFRDVVPLLGDGFESGDAAAWSAVTP